MEIVQVAFLFEHLKEFSLKHFLIKNFKILFSRTFVYQDAVSSLL